MAREHKGKLALDSLLIMPVQRIPRYELLIKVSLVLYGQRWGKCQDEGLKVARIAIDLLLLEADKRNALRRRPEYLDLTVRSAQRISIVIHECGSFVADSKRFKSVLLGPDSNEPTFFMFA